MKINALLILLLTLGCSQDGGSSAPASSKGSGNSLEGQPNMASAEQLETLGKEALEVARADVNKSGWHGVMIRGEGDSGFIFTVGLWKTYQHPEIILFTPWQDPQGMAGNLEAIVKRIQEGDRFEAGKSYQGLFNRFPGAFRRVHQRWYGEYLGLAGGFYEDFDFPALQLFWPDSQNRFPWEREFESSLRDWQPILEESPSELEDEVKE